MRIHCLIFTRIAYML